MEGGGRREGEEVGGGMDGWMDGRGGRKERWMDRGREEGRMNGGRMEGGRREEEDGGKEEGKENREKASPPELISVGLS